MPDAPFHLPEHVLCRKLEDEMVLLNLDSGEYFGLNDTGTRVWELLVDGRSRSEVADRLAEEFAVETDVASGHVTALCEELIQAGLLSTAEESAGDPSGRRSRGR